MKLRNLYNLFPLYEDTYAYSIEMSTAYDFRKVRFFIKGYYANNTNVQSESDVDIAVIQEEVFEVAYSKGVTDEIYNFMLLQL